MKDVNPDVEIVKTDQDINPHNLWKQIAGLSIASIVVTLLGGIILVPAGVFTFADAWTAGISKKKNSESFLNMSPLAWAIVMLGLLLIAYPLYIINRNKLKTKKGSLAFFVITILSGALPIVLTISIILSRLG